MSNIEKIREYFKGDRYATELTGAVIEEAEKNHAKCSLELKGEHKNAFGTAMGGAIFTLADLAFAVASNVDSAPTVAISCSVVYMGAAKEGKITAEANCIHDGRSTCSYIVDIKDDSGRPIASIQCTGFRKNGEPLITSE